MMQQSIHPNDILWIVEQIQRLEAQVARLIELSKPQPEFEKDWYTPTEFATLTGKSAYTVRTWIRLGKIQARNRGIGRGGKSELEIAKTELHRYLNHGAHQQALS